MWVWVQDQNGAAVAVNFDHVLKVEVLDGGRLKLFFTNPDKTLTIMGTEATFNGWTSAR